MSKKAIGIFYFVGLVVGLVLAIVSYGTALQTYNTKADQLAADQSMLAYDQVANPVNIDDDMSAVESDQDEVNSAQGQVIFSTVVGSLIGVIISLFGWINALANLARAQEWTWFILVFLFSGIMLLVYLIAGPQPRINAAPAPYPPPPMYPPPYAAPGMPTPLAGPPSQPISAMDILRQRYARGEIDTATFDEMRARLENSGPPSP